MGVKTAAAKAQKQDEQLRKAIVQKASDPRAKAIRDSFQNFAANLGVGTNQIGAFDTYGFNPITRIHTLLEWIHRGTWVGGVAVDIVADDMTRSGIELKGELDPLDAQGIEEEAVRCGIWPAINDCIRWGRLYGGGLGVILIDGQDVSTPFRIETVGPGMFKGILALDRWMVEPDLTRLVREYGPNLGCPSRYRVNASAPAFTGKWIDYSRCIRFEGIRLPYWQRLVENLWGESVLERIYDRMTAFDAATTGAAQLVHKLHVRTYKLKDFREVVASGGDALAGLAKYVDMMRKFQSIEGMTLLDAEDEYDVHGTQGVSGVDLLLAHFGQQLAGALQIPLVRLFGMSPAGFNATGESDFRNYYDGILQQQESTLRVPLTNVYRCIAQSLSMALPEGFSIKFNPLWQLTDKEKAEIASTVSTAVTNAQDAGLITQQIGMQELRQNSEVTGIFSNITEEHIAQAEEELPPGPTEQNEQAQEQMEQKQQDPEAIASDASAPRIPAKQAGYIELPGAVKDGDCSVVVVIGGISKGKGCCNNFKLGKDAPAKFSCGTCKFHEDKIRVGADAAHQSAAAMAWHHDLPVVIENPKGSERRGRGWVVHMPADYGYIRRVMGADDAELDCYVGPAPESKHVFVINQRKVHGGSFDEHKVMFGYHTKDSAIEDYMLGYPDGSGPKRMMDCYELDMDTFKKWLQGGDHSSPFRVTDEWKESQHPRVSSGPQGGQFTAGGGGGGGASSSGGGAKKLADPHVQGVIKANFQAGWTAKKIAGMLEVEPTKENLSVIKRIGEEGGSGGSGYEALNHPQTQSLIAAKYAAGWSAAEIAEALELEPDDETIEKILDIVHPEMEYKGSSVPAKKHSLTSPDTHKEIHKLYTQGMSTGSIAKQLGFEANPETRKKIRSILRKAGLYKEKAGMEPEPAPQTAQLGPGNQHLELAIKMHALQKQYGDKSVPLAESKKLFDDYYKSLGVSNDEKSNMEQFVKSWTGSSHSHGALSWKRIAAEFYGKDWNKEYMSKYSKEISQATIDAAASKAKKAVIAMKKYAEAYVEKAKIKMVYRGMSGDVAQKIAEAVAKGHDPEITANALSSWTTSYSKAKQFAGGGNGVILKKKVTPENVWGVYSATPWLFSAHYGECEVVVGHPTESEKIPYEDVELTPYLSQALQNLQKELGMKTASQGGHA